MKHENTDFILSGDVGLSEYKLNYRDAGQRKKHSLPKGSLNLQLPLVAGINT